MSLVRCPRRRTTSRLQRRYGCFRLPHVPGAKVVKESKRKDVSWLARTDPDRKEVEFSHSWDALKDPEMKRYIVLHERAHLKTGPNHDVRFYEVLKKLIAEHRIPWKTAYELESYNCAKSH
jgi:predicted metal-dependent hydrolase